MKPDFVVRARELFLSIVDLPPGKRDALLARVAQDDPAIADFVRRLLHGHDHAGPVDEVSRLIGSLHHDEGTGLGTFDGRYRVLRELGRGAMGVVELAHDQVLDRLVALKRLNLPDSLPEVHARRLVEEARAAARLTHPCIATVYSVETDAGGRTVLSMQYCPGESLAERMARQPISREDALRICSSVAEALAAAHEQGVIHRDVKPDNILLTDDGGIRLVDFGIALARRRSGTGGGTVAGTSGYMAPEQAAGLDIDGRADLWSLGAVLKEMLSGETAGPDAPSEPGRIASESADPRLASILGRLLAPDADDRYPDAHSLVADLEPLMNRTAGWDPRRIEPVPVPVDSFVGREQVLEALVRRIGESRLVTLVGPGGVGKTRCAIELLRRYSADLPELTAFVALESVRDPQKVPEAMAAALGVAVPSGTAVLDAVQAALGNTEFLLVLDNFEHVLDAADYLLRLLQRCSGVRALVTSRERLRLRGERDLLLDPLAYSPDDSHSPHPSDAACLFRERSPLFPERGVSADAGPYVERICSAVDGLPLGIELAAAASRTMGLSDIVDAITVALDLLGDDARDRPDRHRTMAETVRWSFELLDLPLQKRLLELSTFLNPFTVMAAARICDDEERAVAADLEVLTDRSFLRRVPGPGEATAYGFLDTIRAFAAGERRRRLDAPSMADRHLAWFAELAREARGKLQGPEQVRWLDRLERSAGDLRAALHWSTAGGDPRTGAALLGDVWRFWLSRGRSQEGRGIVERLLSASPRWSSLEQARLLNILASYERNSGAEAAALGHLEESLSFLRRSGDESEIGGLLNQLSWAHILRSDFEAGRRYAEDALAMFHELGAPRGVAVAANNLGWIANFRDRGDEGLAFHRQSLEIVQKAGDPRAIAFGTVNLAWSHIIEGQSVEATRAVEEAWELWRGVRDPLMEGWIRTVHGIVLGRAGRIPEAIDTLKRAVVAGERFQVGPGLAWALVALGEVERKSGRVVAAHETLHRAMDIGGRVDNHWAAARGRMELAALARDSDERGAAEAHLRAAAQIWERLGNDRQLDHCREWLSA